MTDMDVGAATIRSGWGAAVEGMDGVIGKAGVS